MTFFNLRTSFIVGLLVSALLAHGGDKPPLWETQPFESDPKDLIEAVQALEIGEGQGANVLLRQKVYRFDQQGRLTRTSGWVYQVRTQKAVEEWASTSASWSPWHESKPVIRVRIVNPDGSVHHLSEDMIVESAQDNNTDKTYSDTRVLRAPFPGVVPGSIIEESVDTAEHTSYFAAGSAYRHYFHHTSTQRERLVIEVPKGLPFHYKIEGLKDLEPQVQKQGQLVRYTFQLEDVDYWSESVKNLPYNIANQPMVTFSTGKSWKKLARAYAEIVDTALEGQDFTQQLAEAKPGKEPNQAAQTIMSWINQQVRYTGMELGVNSIVPVSPTQTLERGFGDCKDKAVIMVGMLRQAGFKADVALLRSGYDYDVQAPTPGMGLFNHAIVYLHDSDRFFDPTYEYSRTGELPASDLGRAALIAAKKTKSLKTIPEGRSAQNVSRENKTITLLDKGYGDYREESVFTGIPEGGMRSDLSGVPHKDLSPYFEQAVQENMKAEMTLFEMEPVTDYSKPLEIVIEAHGVQFAHTGENTAETTIGATKILGNLGELFFAESEEPRTQPFRFSFPAQYQWDFTVVPPAGFKVETVPEPYERKLGEGLFKVGFQTAENGNVAVSILLDQGPVQMSAETFEAIRTVIKEEVERDDIKLRFRHEGVRLLDEGDYKGAFSVFNRMIQTHPDNAIHQIRLSKALLKAGMGEEAAAAARRAVASQPENAEAHASLGWILQHDMLGRRFHPGYDRAASVAAYEKALELDPENAVYNGDLAILLEHDGEGFRYNSNDLKRCLELYKAAGAMDKNPRFLHNYVIDLMYLEDFEALAATAPKLDKKNLQEIFGLTALTVLEGDDAALKAAAKIQPVATRRDYLKEIGVLLIKVRRYESAVRFLRQAAKGAANAVQLETFADQIIQFQRIDPDQLDTNKPVDVVKKMIAEFLRSDGFDYTGLEKVLTPQAYQMYNGEYLEELQSGYQTFREMLTQSNLPRKVAMDSVLSRIKANVEGDAETGYRVKVVQIGDLNLVEYFYITNLDGSLKLAGTDAYYLEASAALDYLNAGNTKAAQQWVNWFQEEYKRTKGDDRFYSVPFYNLMDYHTDADGPAVILAAMTAGFDRAPASVKTLKAAIEQTQDTTKRENLTFAMIASSVESTQDREMGLGYARELLKTYPDSTALNHQASGLLGYTGKHNEIKTIAEKRLAENPNDELGKDLMDTWMSMEPDTGLIRAYFDSVVAANDAEAFHYNHMAWASLFQDKLPEDTMAIARRGVQLRESGAILHTLATLYAEVGRCREARQILDKVFTASNALTPRTVDWYVLGRIAEHYGLLEAATRAYQKVEVPDESYIPFNTHNLAQRRLKELANQTTDKDLSNLPK